jgi:hypothetical protein
MAKRVRGSSSRPGQRARLQRSGTARPAAPQTARPAATTPVAPRPATLTPEEEAEAAELEAEILAQEQAAATANDRRTRERSRRAAASDTAGRSSIAERASEEYAYVARDIRRIAIIGGGLVAVLLGFWVIHTVTGLGPI